MKLNIISINDIHKVKLQYNTPNEWTEVVIKNFNVFLQDHVDCERKASAMAMSIIYRAPDKKKIIPQLIETALEEMVHFRQVYNIMQERNILLPHKNKKDNYVKKLFEYSNQTTSLAQERFLDKLLLASIIEFRGAERFRLISENLMDEKIKEFYSILYKSENKHGIAFVDMALFYYSESTIKNRLQELIQKEAEILQNLPLQPTLH